MIHLLALLLLASSPGTEDPITLHRYWPVFPRPQSLLMVPFVGDHELGMTFETAAGLAALSLLEGKDSLLLCEDNDNSGYQRWLSMMKEGAQPEVQGPVDTWAAVERLRDRGIVAGYSLFRYDQNDRPWHSAGPIDESANVATSLAPLLRAVAVSEGFQAEAERLKLPLLMDCRDKTEAWCLDTYGQAFSQNVVMTADPKSRVVRSMGVALKAFVVSQAGPVYDRALARCEPDSPVLGWGCGGEDQLTRPSSEWGLFQTATNWCHNLPVFSSERIGETLDPRLLRSPQSRISLKDVKWEDGVHYATFILSDGDNVQWLMGNFAGGSEGRSYYESPARGKFPFGWTFCYMDLAQVCPYTLMDLFKRATPKDDFVLYGTGYFYPDVFGSKRDEDCLRLHAGRVREYMRLGGLRTLGFNLLDWDCEAAIKAYDAFSQEIPFLDGIFTVQYYPYSGGEGRILWVGEAGREVPIVSARMCIWAQTGRPRDTTPAAVAQSLNAMPRGGPEWSQDHFTFVMPHCWSRFKDTHGDPSLTAEEEGVDQNKEAEGTERGLMPVQWTVDRLDEDVRVVTPTEFLLLLQLHLKTRQTLSEYLDRVRTLAEQDGSKRAGRMLKKAEALLPEIQDGDASGESCFHLLQKAHRLVEM